jgi:hypothetical protein
MVYFYSNLKNFLHTKPGKPELKFSIEIQISPYQIINDSTKKACAIKKGFIIAKINYHLSLKREQ